MLPSKTLASRKEATAPRYKKASFSHFTIEHFPLVTKHLKSKTLPVKVLLVLDNAPSYPSEDELKVDDIEAVFLPPNVTTVIQPMYRGVIESVKRRYRRKLLTSMCEENSDSRVIDLLKGINIKVVCYMIAESWSKLAESTLLKFWQKLCMIVEEVVISTELSTDTFLSALKGLGGCQNVDSEDVELSLAVEKDLQQETLSDGEIIGAVSDVIQDDDEDGTDIDDNAATSIVSHTD